MYETEEYHIRNKCRIRSKLHSQFKSTVPLC